MIPKGIRNELGLRGREEVDVTLREGRIEVQPVMKPMTLVEREGFLAAEVEGERGTRLTVEEVRDLLERLRR